MLEYLVIVDFHTACSRTVLANLQKKIILPTMAMMTMRMMVMIMKMIMMMVMMMMDFTHQLAFFGVTQSHLEYCFTF